jgi:hypothetical protein
MEERPTRKGRGINKTIIDGRVQHKSMEKQIEDGKKGHGEIVGEDTEKQRPSG